MVVVGGSGRKSTCDILPSRKRTNKTLTMSIKALGEQGEFFLKS